MDDLSLRVYLENGSDAMRGGWLELPVVPERLDAFMRGVVGVDDGGGYAVVDHEPGWFGDVLGSDLESFSVSSLNLAARCVAHARDLAVADSVDGDVFLDMLATAAESEDVRFPSGIAALAARAGDVAEFWTEYSLPDSWRAGNSSPDELYGAHVAYGLMGDDALEAFASGWRPPSAEYRPFDIADIVCEGETVADYTLEGDGTNWGAPVYQCVADSFDYAGYAYAAREDDDRQMWCSDDGYIVDADLPNMPPLSARGLEDAVAALETGAAVMDPADPTNMAVTAAESGRAL